MDTFQIALLDPTTNTCSTGNQIIMAEDKYTELLNTLKEELIASIPGDVSPEAALEFLSSEGATGLDDSLAKYILISDGTPSGLAESEERVDELLGNTALVKDMLLADGAKDGKVIVPRGINHRQYVYVTEESSVRDIDVNLEIENSNAIQNSRGRSNDHCRDNCQTSNHVLSTGPCGLLGFLFRGEFVVHT